MSSNTYFLSLEDRLGSVKTPVEMAVRLGMHFDTAVTQTPADQIIAENRGSFTFGTDGVSPLDLANAYATVAARGTKCDPTPVAAILDAAGKPVTKADGTPYDTGNHCTPNVIPAGLADTLNQMMRNDVEPGHPLQTGPRAYIAGHQIAGKTGTIDAQDSVAFVGSTPEYTASVMVFRQRDAESLNGYGGNMPATIWHDAMAPILTNQPTAAFPDADPKYAGPGGVNAAPGGATNKTGNGGGTANPPAAPAPANPTPPADQPPVAPPPTNGNG
jgi:membrane peptidoglycan carboxypeptidase